jgi:hypothetical protein
MIACGCAWLSLAIGCGDDATVATEPCPSGVEEGETVACTCGDAQAGVQTCKAIGTLSECDCSGGTAGNGTSSGRSGDGGSVTGGRGASGSGGSAGDGSSGDGSSGAAGSDMPEEDAGMESPDAGGEMPASTPPMDGTQLAECTDSDECTEGRVCYQTGAQLGNGYCTEACGSDEDCAALGDQYTCNAMGGGGGGMQGRCRIECDGPDDTSCPELMSCVEVGQGEFRCIYPEQEPGAQAAALWEACSNNGDCVEGLVCYGAGGFGGQQGGPGGGGQGNDRGFCTQPCSEQADCTEPAPSGDIEPTCGTSACRFDCSEGGTCPDGMECASQGGGGAERCLFPQ